MNENNVFLKFFREKTDFSNMRLNATMMTVTVCVCLLYVTIVYKAVLWEAYAALFTIAMGGKVAQKYFENKDGSSSTETTETADKP